ncbi:MAG: Crp/Fnr family transcriptional regulator [Pseudomonadota bacterium]
MTNDLHPFQDCSNCPINEMALCSKCDDDERDQIKAIRTIQTFAPGQDITVQGQSNGLVSTIVEGVATVSRIMEDGQRQVAGLLFPEDIVTRPGESVASVDIVAKTPVTLCCFERGQFEDMVEEIPHLASRLSEIAFDERDEAREHLFLLGRTTSTERLASFLAYLLHRKNRRVGPTQVIRLPLSRDEIGSFLGLALETVSRHLNAFARKGMIEIVDSRKIRILDLTALENAAGSVPLRAEAS